MANDASSQRDLETLTALNAAYVTAMQKGDTKRFDEILADDFKCSNPDGALVDKTQFLRLVTPPVKISGLVASDVQIRLMGDFAIIHARINWHSADGRPQQGRYTDDWVRRNGTWVCVSAHVTGEGW